MVVYIGVGWRDRREREPRQNTGLIFPVFGAAINKINLCPWLFMGPGVCYPGDGKIFCIQRQGMLGWRVCAPPWKSGKVMAGVSDLGCRDSGPLAQRRATLDNHLIPGIGAVQLCQHLEPGSPVVEEVIVDVRIGGVGGQGAE